MTCFLGTCGIPQTITLPNMTLAFDSMTTEIDIATQELQQHPEITQQPPQPQPLVLQQYEITQQHQHCKVEVIQQPLEQQQQ